MERLKERERDGNQQREKNKEIDSLQEMGGGGWDKGLNHVAVSNF